MKSPGNKILYTKNLSKFFEGLKALDRVNIAVEKNKVILIIGPNGSGKTTLINVISSFYEADGGQVFFEGEDITNLPPHEIYRRGIIRTFQIPHPLRKLSVMENMLIANDNPGESFIGSIGHSWMEREEELAEKAFNFLKFLKIDHLWDTQAYKLSGGQLKLLEIGRALMADAKLIIMDEPIAGVNPVLAHDILKRVTELKEEISFFIVEHRLDIVLKYVDYVYVMANGRIIAQGSEKDILSDKEVIEVYLGDTYAEA
jgi:branched-chain amino acid transport system ATP-binding protein